MALGIKHTLLRELQLRMRAYDYRVAQRNGPVSVKPILDIAREIADNYAQVRIERNAEHAAYNRLLVADRKAKGLCRRCGNMPPRPGVTTCAECGRRDVESVKRQYDTMRRKPKREA